MIGSCTFNTLSNLQIWLNTISVWNSVKSAIKKFLKQYVHFFVKLTLFKGNNNF